MSHGVPETSIHLALNRALGAKDILIPTPPKLNSKNDAWKATYQGRLLLNF